VYRKFPELGKAKKKK